jgi:hypothetical protein
MRFLDGKELKGKCNSCGSTTTMDSLHKSGKDIIKHL